MNDRLKKLITDIDVNTALSVTVSDLESAINSEGASVHKSQLDEEAAAQWHAETPLTGNAGAAKDRELDHSQLHTISDEIVTEYIDEILLLLIAARDGACGKELLQDIRQLFGTDLSPGTVYPHLSNLADNGVLEMKKLARKKVYYIPDFENLLTRIDHMANQLLSFSLVLKSTVTSCSANQPQSQSHRSETNE